MLPAAESFVGVASGILETLSQVDPKVIELTVSIGGAATATFLWVKAIQALKATALASWIARLVPLLAAGKAGLVGMTVKTALLTKATALLKTVMLSLPWAALAAGIGFVATKTIEAMAAQRDYNRVLKTAPLDEVNDKIAELKTKLDKAKEAAIGAAGGMSLFGGKAGVAALEIAELYTQLARLEERREVLAHLQDRWDYIRRKGG